MIETGKTFPDFRLQDQDGAWKTLKDYAGSWLVLYVYPKDDTPGCTIQGKSFTATKAEFEKMNVKVVGISPDDVTSHRNFCKKFSFTIDLLADPKAELLSKTGISKTEHQGNFYWDRSTFIIDPEGILRQTYHKVKADGHEQVLLQDLKRII